MDTQKRLHEPISALADDELDGGEVELAFAALDTIDGLAVWDVYHRIGHLLRSDRCGHELSAGFGARLAARLAAEAPLRMPAAARRAGKRAADARGGLVATDAAAAQPSDAVTTLP